MDTCRKCGTELAESDVRCSKCGTEVTAEPPVVVEQVTKAEDVKRLLEKVRAEEKKKLYPQIEHQKSEIQKLQQEKDALMKAIQAKDDEVEVKNKGKQSDTEKLLASVEELRQQNIILQKKQEISEQTYKQELEKSRLDTFRAEAIRKAGSDVIPELVYGNTETEIEAAVMASRERYAQIKAEAEAKFKAARAGVPVPGATGQPPQAGNPGNPGAPGGDVQTLTAEMINDMSPEEWEKERLNIRGNVDRNMKQFFAGQKRY